MDELLEGVIHGQKGELERRKAEFVDLQVWRGGGLRCCAGWSWHVTLLLVYWKEPGLHFLERAFVAGKDGSLRFLSDAEV